MSILDDFRAAYPDLSDLNDNDLAEKIHADYFPNENKKTVYDALEYKEPGLASEFGNSFTKAMKELGVLATDGAQAAGYQLLNDTLENITGKEFDFDQKSAEHAVQAISKMEQINKEHPTAVDNYQDIENFKDLSQYVGAMAGQGLGSSLDVLMTGALTGGTTAIAGVGVRAAVKNGLMKAAKAGGKDLIEEQVEKSLKSGILQHVSKDFTKGLAAGTYGGATAAETGSTYIDLIKEGEDRPGIAVLAGALKGGLEVLPEFAAAKRIFKTPKARTLFADKVQDNILKKWGVNIVSETAKIGAGEAVTEALQESIDIAAHDFVFKNELFQAPDTVNRLINAGLAGFIGAGPVGVVTGSYQTVRPDIDPDMVDPKNQEGYEFDESKIAEEVTDEELVDLAEVLQDTTLEQDIGQQLKEAKTDTEKSSILFSTGDLMGMFQDPAEASGFRESPIELQEQIIKEGFNARNRDLEGAKNFDFLVAKARNEPYQPDLPLGETESQLRAIKESELKLTSIPDPVEAKLPRDLKGSKPRYSLAEIEWDNDIAQAAYIVQNEKNKVDRYDEYVQFLKDNGIEHPVMLGRAIKQDLKEQYKSFKEDSPVPLKGKLPDQTKIALRENMKNVADQVQTQQLPANLPEMRRLENSNPDLYDFHVNNLRAIDLEKADVPKFNNDIEQINSYLTKIAGAGQIRANFYKDLRAFNEPNVSTPLRGAQVGHTIMVALNMNEQLGKPSFETGMHETFHIMYQNYLSETDKRILDQSVSKLTDYIKYHDPDFLDVDLSVWDVEELGATAFGLFAQDRLNKQTKGPAKLGRARIILNKIFNFMKGIRDALKKNKVNSVEQLFDSILDGERARNSIETLIEDNRKVRAQIAVSKAISKTAEFGIETPQRAITTIDQMKDGWDKVKKSDQYEFTRLNEFTTKMFHTAPGLAAKDPIWSRIWNNLHDQQKNVNILDSIFIRKLKPILNDHRRLVNASSILDHLNSNDMQLRTNGDGQLVYVRDGKTLLLNKETTSDILAMDDAFRTNLKLWKDVVQEKLKEIEGYDTIEQAIADQEQILNDLKVTETADQRQKVSRAEKRLTELKQAQKTMGMIDEKLKSSVPYFPRMSQGEFGVKIIDTTNPKRKIDQGFAIVGKNLNNEISQQELNNVKKRWEEMGYKGSQYKIEQFRLTRSAVENAVNNNQLSYNLELLASLMSSNNPDLVDDVYGAVAGLGSQLSKTKINDRFFKRNNELLYSKDYASVIPAYFSTSTRALNRFRYAEINSYMDKVLTDGIIPRKGKGDIVLDPAQQELYKRLFDYALKPSTDMAGIRTFNFMWALGFNVSSALLQLVTLPIQVNAAMTAYTGNSLSNQSIINKNFGKTVSLMSKAGYDIDKFGDIDFLNKHLSPDMARAVKVAHDLGEFKPGRAEDMIVTDNYSSGRLGGGYMSGVNRGWNGFKKFMAGPVQLAEETSRVTAFMSLYETLQDPKSLSNLEKGYLRDNNRYKVTKENNSDIDPAVRAALFLIEDTHGIFGKIGRGLNQQGIFGSLLFPFMQHPLMMLGFMARLFERADPRSKAAIAHIMVATTLLAGMYGLPGWELWKALIEKMHKMGTNREIDLHHEMKRALVLNMGFSPRMAEAFIEGIPKAMGIDMARRVSMPFFFQDALIPLMQDKGKIDEFAGVAGSQVRNVQTQLNRLGAGEQNLADAFIESLAPVSFRNAYRAAMVYPNKGVRTGAGTQIMTPEELKPLQLLFKAIGVQPSQISRESEKRNAERLSIYGWQAGHKKIVSKIANKEQQLYEANTEGQKTRLKEDIDKLYKELYKFADAAREPIDRSFHRGVRQSINNHFNNAYYPDVPIKEHKTVESDILEMLYE